MSSDRTPNVAKGAEIELLQPQSAADWLQARQLIEEYATSLRLDLEFQNFAHELAHLADEYSPPGGAFLVATQQGAALGCVGAVVATLGLARLWRAAFRGPQW